MKSWKITQVLFFLLISQYFYSQKDKICFYMMNTQIKESVEEDPRQEKMRNGSVKNYGLEEVNKNEFKKMDETTQKIRERLSTVSLLLQAIPFAWNITKYANETYDYQSKIISELKDSPAFIITALPAQFDFAKKVQDNTLFLYGIVASYGVINQMENKERRILLRFAEEEFRDLLFTAMTIYSNIRAAKQAWEWKKGMFSVAIQQDKDMFKEIIKAL